jgi:hypothetical protein
VDGRRLWAADGLGYFQEASAGHPWAAPLLASLPLPAPSLPPRCPTGPTCWAGPQPKAAASIMWSRLLWGLFLERGWWLSSLPLKESGHWPHIGKS